MESKVQPSNLTFALVSLIFGLLMSGPSCFGLTIMAFMGTIMRQADDVNTLPAGVSDFFRFYISAASVWVILGVCFLVLATMLYRGSERPFRWFRPLSYSIYVYAVLFMCGFSISMSNPVAGQQVENFPTLFFALFMGLFISLFPTTILLMLMKRERLMRSLDQ